MADLIERDALLNDLRSECPECEECTRSESCVECIINRQPAVEGDYEQGFKECLKAECLKELKPAMAKLIEGCTEAIKGITPMMIENAQLHITHAVNRWIPVEDALPEIGYSVLVTRQTENNTRYVRIASRQDDCWMDNTDKYGKPNPHPVIAWQPMPDAYEPPEKGGF